MKSENSILFKLSWLKRTRLGKRIVKARIIERNHHDLVESASKIPWLDDYDFKKVDPRAILKKVYQEYVNSVSTPDKAISIELAYLLWFILKTTRPKLVIDLGSGFSSYLFRYYQSIVPGEGCRVFSCDDNEQWLDRTASFLQSKNLPISGLLLWDHFLAEHSHERPDLILHDLGYMPVRIKTLPRSLDLCSPQTIAIIDDIHKTQMRHAVLSQLGERGMQAYDLTRFTYDRYGRYAWMLTGHRNQ